MSGERKAAARRARRVEILRLLASVAWLVFTVALFAAPLESVLAPVAPSLRLGGLLDSSSPGFVVRATSVPPGGRLFVDGRDRGIAPLVANVSCREGQAVRLSVLWEGSQLWEREVVCREGKTLDVRARLGR